MREVAIVVGDALRKHGIRAVLTGGACANIHSAGQYSSVDADFVLGADPTRNQLDTAMASVSFAREGDRYVHPLVGFFIEFPAGPLAIGEDSQIRPVILSFHDKRTLALSPTDSCRDRLAAYFSWKDTQALAVAVQIALEHRLKWKTMGAWAEAEGFPKEFSLFRRAVRQAKQRRRSIKGKRRRSTG